MSQEDSTKYLPASPQHVAQSPFPHGPRKLPVLLLQNFKNRNLIKRVPLINLEQPSLPLFIQLLFLEHRYSTFSRLCFFATSCSNANMTTLPSLQLFLPSLANYTPDSLIVHNPPTPKAIWDVHVLTSPASQPRSKALYQICGIHQQYAEWTPP